MKNSSRRLATLSLKAGNNKLPNKRRSLRCIISKSVRLDGNATTTAATKPIVTVPLQNILRKYKAFPHGPGGVIMQGIVEKYRYLTARILRLLAYDNRPRHVRWLSKS
jgi:hypothetical protein